jgi:AcrR family transcriptional regulator
MLHRRRRTVGPAAEEGRHVSASPRGRVIDRDTVVRAGRRQFAATCTVDMEALADQLRVSRATLYRVVGSRDALLGDVLWTFATAFFAEAVAATASRGEDRLLEVLRRFGDRMFASAEFRRFLVAEPETAVRVLFTPTGGVHERFVARNRALIAETVARDGLVPRFDVDSLGYVWVRLYESVWYSDLLGDSQPDPGLVEHLARALLTGRPG